MPTGRKIKCDGNCKRELSQAALHWGEGACYGCLECQGSAGDLDLYVFASVQIEEAQPRLGCCCFRVEWTHTMVLTLERSGGFT